ncbi:transporter substrate-binding domain-containing protein [Weissella cibaria]|uniref:transporter substrate-binding domain-containing protein n=1 Tax=Weissella cibaria TaxID=137591 RepID=UPI003857F4B0
MQATVTNALGQTTAAPMLNKHNKQLAKKISQAQRKLEKDGTLKQLSEKYFGADLTKK